MEVQNEDLQNGNQEDYNNIPVDMEASGDYKQDNNEDIDNSYNPKAFDSTEEKLDNTNEQYQNYNNRDYLYDDDFTFKLGGGIYQKFDNLDKECQSAKINPEALVRNRINQLAMAKIIVNIHERNSRLLVQSYANLGEAYIRQNCMESAYDHLTIAYLRNEEVDKNSLEYIKDNVRICKL